MSFGLCFRVKHRPIIFRVIADLFGISGEQGFRRADEAAERSLVLLCKMAVISARLVGLVRRITGHNEEDGDPAVVVAEEFSFIGDVLKNQPLVKRAERRRRFAQIVWCAQNQSIRRTNFFEHRCEIVPADAMSVMFFSLASESGNTAGILPEAIQVENFDFRTRFPRSFRRRIYQ